MRLLHYNDIAIEKLDNVFYPQMPLYRRGKPDGLWVSVEGPGDWKSWCEDERFRLEHLAFAHEVILKKDAKILYLKTPEEIFEFTKQYPLERWGWDAECDTYGLQWDEVKSKYQGIIISPYQWECRLSLQSSWYYGWDCASGCIWDIECIEKFALIKEKG